MEYQDHFLLCANDQYATLSDIVSLTNEGRSTPGVRASRTLKTRFCSVLTCPLNMWIKNYKSTWRKYNQGRSNICCTQVVIFSWTTSSGHYCLYLSATLFYHLRTTLSYLSWESTLRGHKQYHQHILESNVFLKRHSNLLRCANGMTHACVGCCCLLVAVHFWEVVCCGVAHFIRVICKRLLAMSVYLEMPSNPDAEWESYHWYCYLDMSPNPLHQT